MNGWRAHTAAIGLLAAAGCYGLSGFHIAPLPDGGCPAATVPSELGPYCVTSGSLAQLGGGLGGSSGGSDPAYPSQPGVCAGQGADCSSNRCCAPLTCSEFTYPFSCCVQAGHACVGPAECCSGQCTNGSCQCAAVGQACTQSAECCQGDECDPTSQACVHDCGAVCEKASDCSTIANGCGGQCACQATGNSCVYDADCVSGDVCRGGPDLGSCCVPTGGSCAKDADCCGQAPGGTLCADNGHQCP